MIDLTVNLQPFELWFRTAPIKLLRLELDRKRSKRKAEDGRDCIRR